jgi:acyl-CoA thioesterase II
MNTLKDSLELERIDLNLFRGFTPAMKEMPRIYGGQVIAQSLLAAYHTVEGRMCHSLHAYFIHPGDPQIPILFEVDRARDGGSFTTRRVIAIQNGRQIFNLAASFQTEEAGFEHQSAMPAAPDPESLRDDVEMEAELLALAPDDEKAARRRGPGGPLEMRSVEPPRAGFVALPRPPLQRIWMRAAEPLPADPVWHHVILAYASDMALLGTSMRPHPFTWERIMNASLDHAIWFHRPFDFNGWHLYDMDSPSVSGARGFNRGAMYSRDGVLVASVAQEGLLRIRKGA